MGSFPTTALSKRPCPFREQDQKTEAPTQLSLSLTVAAILRHLENFWPVIESVSIKKKKNRNPGSNLDLEPGPFIS